jgi:hypothetical protein
VDCLALSGGIGFHDQALQGELRQALAWLEPLRWQVIPADEERVIARSCLEAAGREEAGREEAGCEAAGCEAAGREEAGCEEAGRS